MELTTLRDETVRRRLKDYVFVQFEAERLNDPTLKPVLDEFGVIGLPTLVVVQPGTQKMQAGQPLNLANNQH